MLAVLKALEDIFTVSPQFLIVTLELRCHELFLLAENGRFTHGLLGVRESVSRRLDRRGQRGARSAATQGQDTNLRRGRGPCHCCPRAGTLFPFQDA